MTSPLVSLGGRGASGERLRTLIGPTLWGGESGEKVRLNSHLSGFSLIC